ncbi:MAG: bacteriochlorophyll 4-vinyl reductase [Burkholderiales bacterium]|nr:MAG: bacteriochlorophyll 4-vinyl reductase [Burkholderiales bacterium]
MVATDVRGDAPGRRSARAAHVPARPLHGRIGPNAITRIAQALRDEIGDAATRAVFARAALGGYLDAPPREMVDEAEVRRLHAEMGEAIGTVRAAGVAREAGTLTGDYLLARRIPGPAQAVLKRLPAALAERMLLAAVGRHAWTFAGSGRFTATPGAPTVVEIADNPLCRGIVADAPACHYHAATFERLWRTLVSPRARVVETACCACGAPACRFELRRP